MRLTPLLLLCACATTAPDPEPTREGSHAELLRPRATPGPIAALDAEVRRLKALVRRADRPGPILLRLADTLLERATAHGREEMLAQEAIFEHRSDPDAREAAEVHGRTRVADLTGARRILEAVRPDWPEAARARTMLFYLLAERREWQADAAEAAHAIVESERTGALLAAAHLRLAEAAFIDARLEEALTHYDAVLATEGADPQSAAFASYKRAWVLFNLQRFREADGAFARTLELARAHESGNLARETAKDRLRVHIPLRTPAPALLAVIEESTDDPALRATLVERYERMLRDAGQLDLAEAFRRHVLR